MLQGSQRRHHVRRPDDGVHQQQAARPAAQRDPVPAAEAGADQQPDGAVPARQGRAAARCTHTHTHIHIYTHPQGG